MTATSDRSSERDAVLADLHDMLAEAGRGDVVAFAAAHPQYRSEILAFATEWIALAPSTEDDAEDRAPPDIPSASVRAALERFWAKPLPPAADPFADLDFPAIERIVAECRIDIGILRKLEKRLIDALTVPGKLLAWLAWSLGSDIATLFSYLGGAPVSAGADYFAPGGPKTAAGKISFAEAVRTSQMSDDEKDFWLRSAGS
ncbi:hypothetical protein [Sphingopyxis sp.]|uniref:hypothetical protein n=1 Tax=Sphingopyxis sp. TaxID=1908224 RepID=UPI0035B0EC84